MNIIYVSSEVAPFAKTGGLADVAGALPKVLAEQGHDVCVMMPLYRHVGTAEGVGEITDTGVSVSIPLDGRQVTCQIHEGRLPGSTVRIYFVRNDAYFDRPELYNDPGTNAEYDDNCERFVVFSRAVLEAAEALRLRPDVIHCNDWQSALIPVYVKTLYAKGKGVSNVRTVLTVHNLAYQGLFWHWDMKLTGLDWKLFNWKELEYYGKLNLLKGGLVFADIVNTVSRRYAKEIQTVQFGCGLEGVLGDRAADLYGVVNGIDYAVWNPEVDTLIPAPFSAGDPSGKEVCKRELLKAQGLPEPKQRTPLIGIISRLATQKGFDILEIALAEIMALDLQIVVLGTGEKEYHAMFEAAAAKYPDKLAANLTFNNQLAHQIEAGADMFLMPSHYEPCGLNQLYSLRYGTVPIVRATGGLFDTIADYDENEPERGTGFAFRKYNPVELLSSIERALAVYAQPRKWAALMQTGMRQDWSWGRSAREYAELYEKALAKPR